MSHILPSPPSCRQRLRKGSVPPWPPAYAPGRVGLPTSLPQGALAAAKQRQPLDTRMRQKHPVSHMGQAADTRRGAGSVPLLVGSLSPGSLDRGFHWCPLLPLMSTDALHFLRCPTSWHVTSNRAPSPTHTVIQVGLSAQH